MGSVCAVDGVPITEAFGGRLVHTDELPDGVDPVHEIEPVDPSYLERREKERGDVHQLAAELIAHHTVVHPMSDCVFASKLAQALRSKR